MFNMYDAVVLEAAACFGSDHDVSTKSKNLVKATMGAIVQRQIKRDVCERASASSASNEISNLKFASSEGIAQLVTEHSVEVSICLSRSTLQSMQHSLQHK